MENRSWATFVTPELYILAYRNLRTIAADKTFLTYCNLNYRSRKILFLWSWYFFTELNSKYKQLKIDLEGHPLTFIKGGLDLGQECGPDDAAAPPHERDAAEVQVPAVRVPGLS